MITPVAHRINSLEASLDLPKEVGIEFDVHAYKNELVVAHDAFRDGVKLSSLLEISKDRLCAINVKEEGIEEKIIELSYAIGVKSFFLFDVNFPQIYRFGEKYSQHFCLRLSQLEKPSLSECRSLAKFLWIDTFNGEFWMNDEDIKYLKSLGYNLCFVSPELHRPPKGDHEQFILELKNILKYLDPMDSICTKHIDLWRTKS